MSSARVGDRASWFFSLISDALFIGAVFMAWWVDFRLAIAFVLLSLALVFGKVTHYMSGLIIDNDLDEGIRDYVNTNRKG